MTKTPPKSITANTRSSEDVDATPNPQVGTPLSGLPYPATTASRYTMDSTPTLIVEKPHGLGDVDEAFSKNRIQELSKLVSQVDEKPSYSDPDGTMLKRSKQVMTVVKIIVMTSLLSLK